MLLSGLQDTLDTLSYADFEHSLTEVIDKTTPYTSAYIVSAVLSFQQVCSFSSTSIGQTTARLCIIAAAALVYTFKSYALKKVYRLTALQGMYMLHSLYVCSAHCQRQDCCFMTVKVSGA